MGIADSGFMQGTSTVENPILKNFKLQLYAVRKEMCAPTTPLDENDRGKINDIVDIFNRLHYPYELQTQFKESICVWNFR